MNKFNCGFFPPPIGSDKSRIFTDKKDIKPIIDLTSVSYNAKNNERLIPSGSLLADRRFSIGLWLYIQNVSKCNHMNNSRYIKKELCSPTILRYVCRTIRIREDKEYHLTLASRSTTTKYMSYLKENGFITGEVDGRLVFEGYKGAYYEVKNKDVFDKYVLLGNDFLELLLENLSQEAIKVYLIYYSYNSKKKGEGVCFLNQDEILNRIGLSASGKNYTKLRYINKQLESLGLIFTEKHYIKQYGLVVKTKTVTRAPMYWDTKLYKEYDILKFRAT